MGGGFTLGAAAVMIVNLAVRSYREGRVFQIDRDGHVNVNQAERLHAIRVLNTWLDHGPSSLPRPQPGQEEPGQARREQARLSCIGVTGPPQLRVRTR